MFSNCCSLTHIFLLYNNFLLISLVSQQHPFLQVPSKSLKPVNPSPPAIRTSKKECVECWSKRIKETEVGTDWDLAEKRCWRCGKETELQRCHLIPDSLGGKDEASNIVLLCDK